MGTIRNKMVIIHHYNKDVITEMRNDAIEHFQKAVEEDIGRQYDVSTQMVSPILESYINGEYSFVIMGECSKLGWETADIFERWRQKYINKWSENEETYKLLEVDFGEEYPCKIEEYN